MRDKFKKMLMKKAEKGDFLSDDEKSAKLGLLSELKGMLGGEIAKDIRKVTVMAPDAEGLQKGLEKAKEVVKEQDEIEGYDKNDRIKKLEEELAALKK